MNSISKARRHGAAFSMRLRVAALVSLVSLASLTLVPNTALALVKPAQAAIKTVANFDANTWAPLLKKGPRPAAYVFTNTFCPSCPEAFALLNKTIQASGKPVALVGVVMDVPANKALAYSRHYTGVTQLYAFDGYEPEIRQTIDPSWRNITPYSVLVGRDGAVQRVTGLPDAEQLKAWLR
ncbi:MAG: hypothetical protein RIR09_2233 [Pseudomonadota bacterium]|jgi:hypothetical protein